jgi:hypothetical protein
MLRKGELHSSDGEEEDTDAHADPDVVRDSNPRASTAHNRGMETWMQHEEDRRGHDVTRGAHRRHHTTDLSGNFELTDKSLIAILNKIASLRHLALRVRSPCAMPRSASALTVCCCCCC